MNIEQAKVVCRVPEQQKLAVDLNMQGWLKYLTEDQFLEEKLELFKILELDKRKNQKILDIGAGLGHFGSISKHYGHSYLGTYFGRTDRELRPFYQDAGLDLTECKLFPNYDKTIPQGPWDCIIMVRTTFELNAEWTVDDWKELVDNCMKNLNPGGQILIKSNLSIERRSKYGNLDTQCQEIMLKAFSGKTPLPYWQWATWHWIKE